MIQKHCFKTTPVILKIDSEIGNKFSDVQTCSQFKLSLVLEFFSSNYLPIVCVFHYRKLQMYRLSSPLSLTYSLS